MGGFPNWGVVLEWPAILLATAWIRLLNIRPRRPITVGIKSVFDALSLETRTELDSLILNNGAWTTEDFRSWLESKGFQASRSATGRYLLARRAYLSENQNERKEQHELMRLDRIKCLEIASRYYRGESPESDLIPIAEKLYGWASRDTQ